MNPFYMMAWYEAKMNSYGKHKPAGDLSSTTDADHQESAQRQKLVNSILGKLVFLTNDELVTINTKLERKNERFK